VFFIAWNRNAPTHRFFSREIDRSCKPLLINYKTSFLLASGRTKFKSFSSFHQEFVVIGHPKKITFFGNAVKRSFVNQAARHVFPSRNSYSVRF
jgi:hypothetical protein